LANLSEGERKRLAAILGMLGSDAPGERDNAARLAEQFRRQHGLTWTELLALSPVPGTPGGEEGLQPHPPRSPLRAKAGGASAQRLRETPWRGIIATALIGTVVAGWWFVQAATGIDRRQEALVTSPLNNSTGTLSVAQRGAIADHVRECWTIDDSTSSDERMQVLLNVITDAAGIAREAEVTGKDLRRMNEANFHDFAEHAMRTVLDPRCAKLPLPVSMLGRPNMLTFRFSP
jgi:hypothetical protein